MGSKISSEGGFALVASGVCALAMFGMAGLALDLGRMYIVKNEAQNYTDSAAISAATKLDGTVAGLTNADTAVANNTNKWNFNTSAFTGTVTEYSADGVTGWATSGGVANPASVRYVRITASVNNVA